MNTIGLEIWDSKYRFSLQVERRINFVKGDSGTGKTTFYNMLGDYLSGSDTDGVMLESTYKVNQLGVSTIETAGLLRDRIFVVDDVAIVKNMDFICLLAKRIELNHWYIIMSREEADSAVEDDLEPLVFSIQSLYRLACDGARYFLDSLYSLGRPSSLEYDYVIVEDTYGCCDFLSVLLGRDKVVSTHGEGNVISVVDEYQGKCGSLLVVFDGASFGRRFQRFYNLFSLSKCRIDIIPFYECFEGLLSKTNMLNQLTDVRNGLSNIVVEANRYPTWEAYFEVLVSGATSKKPYKYVHGAPVPVCYLLDCASAFDGFLDADGRYAHVCPKCDYRNKCMDKFTGLLEGTEYGFLLGISVTE